MTEKPIIQYSKLEMGYTEEKPVKCENCKYSEERENPHLDRSWDTYCMFSNLCEFIVSNSGRCSKFKAREVKG